MNVQMAAFGSQAVTAALDDFRAASDSFFLKAGTLRTIQSQAMGQALTSAFEARDLTRQEARDTFERLAAAINVDLATL